MLQVFFVSNVFDLHSHAVTLIQGFGLDGPWGMVLGKKLFDINILLHNMNR